MGSKYIGQQSKTIPPGLKKSRFNFSRGDRWVDSTKPREFARDKK